MNTEQNPLEKAKNSIKNSVLLKMVTIAILVLILLIPSYMIDNIIREREGLNREASNEVHDKWAGNQKIIGPILTIPYEYTVGEEEHKTVQTSQFHILPSQLNIEGEIDPKKLNRGIYDIIVYKSLLNFSGAFNIDHLDKIDNIDEIKYDQAYISIGISDLKGIKNQVKVKWNEQQLLDVKPGAYISNILKSGITVMTPNIQELLGKSAQFTFSLDLQGSKNLSLAPLGSQTNVSLNSPWNDPSFTGNYLPDSRETSEAGFRATWSILELNRNFPQMWQRSKFNSSIASSLFGVNLIIPLDDYQKSLRSSKYAVMTIALTFLIFFLVEVLNKRKIHPFQYILVGLALCLYYILLVSISEHSSFNFAYLISTLTIISIITLYSISVFKKIKFSMILTCALIGIYGFLFVTLQLTDYALLMVSIGLTIILAITMYSTRNINWYRLNFETE